MVPDHAVKLADSCSGSETHQYEIMFLVKIAYITSNPDSRVVGLIRQA